MIITIPVFIAFLFIGIFGDVRFALAGAACLILFTVFSYINNMIFPVGTTKEQVHGSLEVDGIVKLTAKFIWANSMFCLIWLIPISLIMGIISIFK
jgi:hypothetical protein